MGLRRAERHPAPFGRARGSDCTRRDPFKRNDYVGQYPHDAVVGHYPTREAAREAPETRRLLMRGHDKLVTVRAPNGPGFLLLDGEGGGPPHVERANDPRGTALAPNATLTDAGWLRITQARVPRFDLEKPLDENIYSELRYDYGDSYWPARALGYWDLHELLGRRAAQPKSLGGQSDSGD